MAVYVDIKKNKANYSWMGESPANGDETFPKGKTGNSITRGVKQSEKSWDKGTTGIAGATNPSYGSVHANRAKFR